MLHLTETAVKYQELHLYGLFGFKESYYKYYCISHQRGSIPTGARAVSPKLGSFKTLFCVSANTPPYLYSMRKAVLRSRKLS